ncbi:MAG: 4'-phosphopantetheinyl transferase superfamily protein [Chitinophagaceae bacterium]|nr:4'-phosphopantetheinyl transferase superfamily protein [Chitinophagaceae bacterium]MCB0741686.1 4'-phosphopantetheinyl transferase superfamily protein [Chitinophagaceae bacterium]HQU56766.1 4'-phosphopantetheinyl transferase superfamily protein [Chitinophagaceae bacterium]HQV07352.1 4'-phosphopantetheinyl transferase superfamily protein [Chitinophagaceae bacterium]
MPIFYQQQINEHTRLGIWSIQETEEFFRAKVPLHRQVSHPHKQLQHLAGRYLLAHLYPDFPAHLIQIADTNKPYLPDEQFHFSISHCGNFAAAIVSQNKRVGIDIEIPVPKILKVQHKFIAPAERTGFFSDQIIPGQIPGVELGIATLIWSAKEAVFKWYGDGKVDFRRHIRLRPATPSSQTIHGEFSKINIDFTIHYKIFDPLVLTWVMS